MAETKSQNLKLDATAYEPHPIADIFPLMEGKPFDELVADIKAHGLKEQIKLWQDKIIDGRNRYRACKLAKVKPIYKDMNFADEEAALDYVTSRNIQRRHLTVAERSLAAARIVSRRAKTGTGTGSTQSKAAEMLGVSESSVRNAKAVLDHGDKELVAAVEAGQIGVREGAGIARHGPPPESEAPFEEGAEAAADEVPGQVYTTPETATAAAKQRQKVAEEEARYERKKEVFWQLSGIDQRKIVSKWLRGERLDSERANFIREAFGAIIEKATKERLLASLTGAPVDFHKQSEKTDSKAIDLSPELLARVRAGELRWSEAAKLHREV